MAAPLLAVGALIAPIIGGAMSLAGGAMSMTGGLLSAGSVALRASMMAGEAVVGAAKMAIPDGDEGGDHEHPEYDTGDATFESVGTQEMAQSQPPALPEPSTELMPIIGGGDLLGAQAAPAGTKMGKDGLLRQDKGGPGGGQILGGQMKDGELLPEKERFAGAAKALGAVKGKYDRTGLEPVQQILDHVKFIGETATRIAAGVGALVSFGPPVAAAPEIRIAPAPVFAGPPEPPEPTKPEETKKPTVLEKMFPKIAAMMKARKAAKNLKGQDTDKEKKKGMFAKGFDALKSKMKDTTDGLKKTGGWMLKALALGGVFLAYNKFKSGIDGLLGGVFKGLHNLYKGFESGDFTLKNIWGKFTGWLDGIFTRSKEGDGEKDGLWDKFKGWLDGIFARTEGEDGGIWDKFMDWVEEDIWPPISRTMIGMFDWLFNMIKSLSNEHLGTWWDVDPDWKIDQQANRGEVAKNVITEVDEAGNALTPAGRIWEGMTDEQKNTKWSKQLQSDIGDKDADYALRDQLAERLQSMKVQTQKSNNRIQWKGIDTERLLDWNFRGMGWTEGNQSSLWNFTPNQIMNAVPIIDGVEMSWGDLSGFSLETMGRSTDLGALSDRTDLFKDLESIDAANASVRSSNFSQKKKDKMIKHNDQLKRDKRADYVEDIGGFNRDWGDDTFDFENIMKNVKSGMIVRADLAAMLHPDTDIDIGKEDKARLEKIMAMENEDGSLVVQTQAEVRDALKSVIHNSAPHLVTDIGLGLGADGGPNLLEKLIKQGTLIPTTADGSEKTAPIAVVSSDNRNQSVTRMDTVNMPVSSKAQEPTALMLAYAKNFQTATGLA